MKDEKLLNEFQPSTAQEWIQKIEEELKDGKFEQFIWKTDEGFEVMPFYTAEHADTSTAQAYQHTAYRADEATFNGARSWVNRAFIQVPAGANSQERTNHSKEANRQALHALNHGASALLFQLNDLPDFTALLREVELAYCPVSFRTTLSAGVFMSAFASFIADSGTDPASVSGALFSTAPASWDELASVADRYNAFDAFRLIGLQAAPTATTLSERIAGLLLGANEALTELTERGIAAERVASLIEADYELGNNYFFEIASLRALRTLLQGLFAQYGANSVSPADFYISVCTRPEVSEQTRKDPYLNMLSNTTQAMSGVLGGCNALTVMPHNLGLEEVTEAATRTARNVSNILKDEAYFDKVADPAAGSYYLDALSEKLAQSSWDLFRSRLA